MAKNVKGKRWQEQVYPASSAPPGAVSKGKLGNYATKKVSCNTEQGHYDGRPCPRCMAARTGISITEAKKA